MPTTRSWTTSRNRSTNYSRFNTRTTGLQNTLCKAGWSTNSPKFNCIKDECAWRIGSYQMIYSQCTGPGNTTPFSPNTANKWVKYINTGARVYKFNNVQFCRYFGTQWTNMNPTYAYRYLRQKFGAGIKAVCKGKGNTWLVAATANVTARPFNNYNWK